MKKKLALLTAIILGVILFKLTISLVYQLPEPKSQEQIEEEFWDSEITLKSDGTRLNFTPTFFFLTMPTMGIYPENSIVYFSYLDSSFRGDTTVITGTIIQNKKVIYKNSYYFYNRGKAALFKIVTEDLTTGSVDKIESDYELKSLMQTYKTFIDLWILYDTDE